jgi:hypothetical protein
LGRPRVHRQGGSRFGERGELRRKVIHEKKKLLARNPVHARPRVSALSSCRGRHCRWTMAGPWRERTGTSVSKDRALDGDGDRALVGEKGRGR